ncbi:MAG: hypothetical protein KBS55_05945 [Bacteroidales bacterium]|nr:hypothetical protein [Candidatus Cryptobacteroides aphodequi]
MKKTLLIAALCTFGFAAFAQQGEKEELYNQYGVKVTADPLVAEAQDGILVLRSKDSGYKIWFDNRVQADGAVFFGQQDWADPIGNGVSIRRARFAVKAQITPDWYGEVDMDMANGVFELKDAIIRYDGIKNTHIQIGNFKELFSIQRNNSSRYLQFMERPMVTQALAPSRHLGLNVNYAKDWLWASSGVFFQSIDNLETRTFVEDNNKLTNVDADEGLSFTEKIVFMPGWNKNDWGMHIGLAGSYRQPKTDGEAYLYDRFSTRNTNSINRKKYIDTGDFGKVHHDLLYTVEFAGYWKCLRYEAAYIGSQTTLQKELYAGTGLTKNFGGWYAQAGWLLFGGRQRYDSNGAKFTRVQRGQDWGDIELCARVEHVDLNADMKYWNDASYEMAGKLLMGGSAMGYSLGVNYYINDHVKMMLDYQYTDNDQFASGKSNKFFCGLDTDGKPTRDPRKVAGEGGVNLNMVSLRLEIDF